MRTFRALGALAAVLAAGTLAACGAVPAAGPAAVSATHGTSTAGASGGQPGQTAAGNRGLARREAARLLSMTPRPPGATPLAAVPGFAPPASRPEVGSLVDLPRAWRLALPFGPAAAWLRAHPPRHLPAAGSGTGSGAGGAQFAEVSYRGPASPAWSSAELDIEVVRGPGGSTVLRADAMVSWLDPVPLPDTAAGPRMRLTVAGACPGSDARYAARPGVANPGIAAHGDDLAHRLLPAAAPTAGLECRYYGGNGPAYRLRSATRLDAAQARRLAAAMTAMPLSHLVGAVTSCPSDDGTAEVVALSYPGRPDVDLWVKGNGCIFVSNGYIRTAGI
jgi:hypothetical protein